MTLCALRKKARWRADCRTIVRRWRKDPSGGRTAGTKVLRATGNAARVAGLRGAGTVLVALTITIRAAMAAGAAPTEMLPLTETFAECAPADAVLAQLRGRYRETPFWIGSTDGGGNNIVLTRRRDGGSWTLLAIGENADGVAIACMIAAGVGADPVVPTQ